MQAVSEQAITARVALVGIEIHHSQAMATMAVLVSSIVHPIAAITMQDEATPLTKEQIKALAVKAVAKVSVGKIVVKDLVLLAKNVAALDLQIKVSHATQNEALADKTKIVMGTRHRAGLLIVQQSPLTVAITLETSGNLLHFPAIHNLT
jgi:hypothetical protein